MGTTTRTRAWRRASSVALIAWLAASVLIPTPAGADGDAHTEAHDELERVIIALHRSPASDNAHLALGVMSAPLIGRDVAVLALLPAADAVVAEVSAAARRRLESLPGVELVLDERVRIVTASPVAAADSTESWALDRLDQAHLPLDGRFSGGADGSDVEVFVVDTGLDGSHAEFEGRVGAGLDLVRDGRGVQDCNGHGTQVASLAVGATLGAAPAATVRPLRVLDCDGSGWTSDVIRAIDWAREHRAGPAVLNLSIGGGASDLLDAAIRRAVDDDIVVTVAAGNAGADACATSPARAPAAISVGASDPHDQVADFSNQGACVDVFAPGVATRSAAAGTGDGYTVASGTSQSAPLVAGLAALVLSVEPDASSAEVRERLFFAAAPGVLSGLESGSPDRLAQLPQPTVTSQSFEPADVVTAWGWLDGTDVWVSIVFAGDVADAVAEVRIAQSGLVVERRVRIDESGVGSLVVQMSQGPMTVEIDGGAGIVEVDVLTAVRMAEPVALPVSSSDITGVGHVAAFQVPTAGAHSSARVVIDDGPVLRTAITDSTGRAWFILDRPIHQVAVRAVTWNTQTP